MGQAAFKRTLMIELYSYPSRPVRKTPSLSERASLLPHSLSQNAELTRMIGFVRCVHGQLLSNRLTLLNRLQVSRGEVVKNSQQLLLGSIQIGEQRRMVNMIARRGGGRGIRDKELARRPIPNGRHIEQHHKVAARHDNVPDDPVHAIAAPDRRVNAVSMGHLIGVFFDSGE